MGSSELESTASTATAAHTEGEEISLQLALKGNPEFLYDKLYFPGTSNECPSYKCFKCPTSVDRMERLDSHNLSHGAIKKFKCKFCDFSVDQMHVILRHEEIHRAQKQKKEAKEKPPATLPQITKVTVTPPEVATASSIQTQNSTVDTSSPAYTSGEEEAMEDDDIEIDIDSGEEVNVDIESEEEMELDVDTVGEAEEVNAYPDQNLEQEHGLVSPKEKLTSVSKTKPDKNLSNVSSITTAKKETEPISWNCQYCPATFKFQSFQKRHELLHFGKRPYSCKRCTFSTTASFALKEHTALHKAQATKTIRAASPTLSVASSASSTSNRRSRSKDTSRSQRSNSISSLSDDIDNSDSFRVGNPKFTYAKQFRFFKNIGETVEVPSYKCLICPSAYCSLRDLKSHVARHGIPGTYRCKVCDYTHNAKHVFIRHLDTHRSQGNVPLHLLTFQGMETTKGGFSIGEANEVAIVGNENDFEIEVEDVERISLDEPEILISNPITVSLPQTSVEKKLPKPKTPSTPAVDHANATSSESEPLSAVHSTTHLLVSMKVTNFMCFEDISFNLNSEAVTFSGGEGKSTSIIAILLCLGYDLLIENSTPSVICGWEISDVIRRGKEVATIEITLCFTSYPNLFEKYGNELKIRRTLRRGVPLASSTFQLTSEKEMAQGFMSPKSISVSKLRSILTELSILPLYARLLLLDRQNLKAVMNDSEPWYDYFLDAVAIKGKFLRGSLEKLMPQFERLDGDISWRKTQLRFLEDQLQTDYPIEQDSVFLQWREDDVKRLCQLKLDLDDLMKKYTEVEKLTVSYTQQLESVPSVVLKEMRTIFMEFLATQNLIGDIFVDDKEKILRIWLREKGTSLEGELPINAQDASEVWHKTPPARKQMGIFGLYLGFWKVFDTCPFFAVDAYSSAELEFKFPAKGLPVLMRLVRSKSKQQFLMSYPES